MGRNKDEADQEPQFIAMLESLQGSTLAFWTQFLGVSDKEVQVKEGSFPLALYVILYRSPTPSLAQIHHVQPETSGCRRQLDHCQYV